MLRSRIHRDDYDAFLSNLGWNQSYEDALTLDRFATQRYPNYRKDALASRLYAQSPPT